MEPIYASMLREIGITVSDEEIESATEPLPRPASPPWVTDRTSPEFPNAPSYTALHPEPPDFVVGYVHMTHLQPPRRRQNYIARSHFQAVLAQVTGRLPSSPTLTDTYRILRRSRLNVHQPLAYFRARSILRRHGKTSPHYRCIFAALGMLGGPLPHVSSVVEQQICSDFDMLDQRWRTRPDMHVGRKSRPSFYCVVRFLFEKYGVKTFYAMPGLKDKKKYERVVELYLASLA